MNPLSNPFFGRLKNRSFAAKWSLSNDGGERMIYAADAICQ